MTTLRSPTNHNHKEFKHFQVIRPRPLPNLSNDQPNYNFFPFLSEAEPEAQEAALINLEETLPMLSKYNKRLTLSEGFSKP